MTSGRLAFGHRLAPLAERLRPRWWVGLLAALAVAFVGSLTVELLKIRNDLNAGRQALANLDLRRVDDEGGLAEVVGRAADRIDAADHRARTSLPLRALGAVPFLGSQVDTIRDLTGVGKAIADQGRVAADNIEAALRSGSGPASRIDIVRAAGAEIQALREVVAAIELDTRRWLVPPLNDARHELDRELREAGTSLEKGVRLAEALEGFLTGPRRYLILGGNNAEMRAVGIPTTSGIATIENGTVAVGEFSEANPYIELPEPGVPVHPGFDEMYGFLEANRGYRTALASPNWPYAASVMADITRHNIYGEVDGIIYVDTVTLANLMTVVGSVRVGDTTYYPFDIVYKLLHENYLEFGTREESAARRAEQSAVAQAVFDALDQRDYSIITLAGVLSEMARGRHLLGWSSDPHENELWRSFGAGGELPEDGLVITSSELGASKLDFCVTMAVAMATEHVDDRIDVTLDVTIENPTLAESSPYIDGGSRFAHPGEYGSYLVITVPRAAFNLGNAEYGFVHHGEEPPLHSAGIVWAVPEGTSKTTRITFSLPGDAFSMTIIPSARLIPTTWNYEGKEFDDSTPVEIDLDRERIVEDDTDITDRNPAAAANTGGSCGAPPTAPADEG